MKVQVSLDFCWNMELQEFLAMLEKHGARMVTFVVKGPGGGNPNVLIEFPSIEEALDHLREHYPDDTEEFHRSLCDPVPPTFLVPNV